jgi:hypothetical protein
VQDDDTILKSLIYCFPINFFRLMFAMRDLGDKAKWARKNEMETTWQDKSKWCAFHEDFGHITEDFIAL